MPKLLTLFPDLLTYGLIAPFILRVSLGLVLVYFSYLKFGKERMEKITFFESIGMRPGAFYVNVIGSIELIGGILLVVGAYTQAAALIGAFIMLVATFIKWRHPQSLRNDIEFYILLFVVALSLVFLGAGFWAIDLPL
jgi:putative oxidoreductase